jgi:hypothetical protein
MTWHPSENLDRERHAIFEKQRLQNKANSVTPAPVTVRDRLLEISNQLVAESTLGLAIRSARAVQL